MHFVYIIYSKEQDRYYVGETDNMGERLVQHNTGFFKGAYTSQAKDWEIFLLVQCIDRTIARKFESFIKRMKSRKFIERLKSEPELVTGILNKIQAEGHSPEDSGRTL